MNMRHLYFCGIKHSGKSTLGKLAAKALGYSWVDLDDLVLHGIAPYHSIREFYQAAGKDAFMEEEVKALRAFLSTRDTPPTSSALGGEEPRTTKP